MTDDDERLYLLDTCALIWIAADAPISAAAEQKLASPAAKALLSPISAWEIGMLVAKGRLRSTLTPKAYFDAASHRSRVRLAALTTEVLIASSFLPGDRVPRDPADRIIAATARETGAILVTRDRSLLAYAEEGHLEALAC